MPTPSLDVRFYDRTGTSRRTLQGVQVVAGSRWKRTRYGGYADATLTLTGTTAELSQIQADDRVRIFVGGSLRWSGKVTEARRVYGDPPQLSVTAAGRFKQVGDIPIDSRFLYDAPVDIREVFSDIGNEALAALRAAGDIEFFPGPFGDVVLGVPVRSEDVFNKTLASAFASLSERLAGNAVYGCDEFPQASLTDAITDRLFLRAIGSLTSPDYAIPVPGPFQGAAVGAASGGPDISKIANTLTITGSGNQYPNLLGAACAGNVQFERPYHSEAGSAANLVPSPGFSFEPTAGAWPEWGLFGGADIKSADKSEGPARSGEWMLELDAVGERATIADRFALDDIVAGTDVVAFGGYARRELSANAAEVVFRLRFYDAASGGSQVGGTQTETVSPGTSAAWADAFVEALVAVPAAATHAEIEIELTAKSGATGIIVDDVFVYKKAVLQEGWKTTAFGSASFNVGTNFKAARERRDGRYSVYVDVSASDADDQDASLEPLGRFPVDPNSSIVFGGHFKSPAGVTANGKMFLELHWFKEDGGSAGSPTEVTVAAGSGWSDWTQVNTGAVTVPSDARQARAVVRFRGNTQVYIDSLFVRNSAAPILSGTDYEWVDDGPYRVTLDVTDIFVDGGADDDLHDSIEDYGLRHIPIQSDGVFNRETAFTFAELYFRAFALPFPHPQVPLTDTDITFEPGQTVRLTDAAGPWLSLSEVLPIAEVEESVQAGGAILTVLSLEEEERTIERILLEVAKLAQRQQSGGGVAQYSGGGYGGSTSSGGAGGGGSGGPFVTIPLPIGDIDATGTTDATTFLRGDGAWAKTPAADGWAVISSNPCKPASRFSTASAHGQTSRVEVVTPARVRAIRLVYANWYTGGTGETTNTNPFLIKATAQPRSASSINDSTTDPVYNATFGSRPQAWVPRGRHVVSDPIHFGANEGSRFFVKSFYSAPLPPAPSAPTASASGSGSALGAGTYGVSITYAYPDGAESFASASTAVAVLAGENIAVTSPASPGDGAIGYRVWMTYVGGSNPHYDTASGILPFGTNFTISSSLPGAAAQAIEQVEAGGTNAYIPIGGGVLGGTNSGSANNGEGYYTGQDRTGEGRAVSAAAAGNLCYPVAVLGYSEGGDLVGGVALIGDSLVAATGDAGFGMQRGGFLQRAVLDQTSQRIYDVDAVPLIGHIMQAQGSETAAQFAGNTGNKRSQIASMCEAVIGNHGTNDLASGSAAIAASLITIAKRFTVQGKPFFQCTLAPRTSSTDGWRTVANQSVPDGAAEATRRAINNWIASSAASSTISNEVPFRAVNGQGPSYDFYGGGNGSATRFYTAYPFEQGTQLVTIDAAVALLGVNYTYLGTATIDGVAYASGVEFTAAPGAGEVVEITYDRIAGFLHAGSHGLESRAFHFDTATEIEVNAAGTQAANGGWVAPIDNVLVAQRPVTGTSANSLTDSTQSWTVDEFRGYCMMIVADAGTPAAVGQVRCIQYNTATQLVTNSSWTTTPSASAEYIVLETNMTDGVHPSSTGHMALAGGVDIPAVLAQIAA